MGKKSKYKIVRSKSAGVFFGEIEKIDGQTVTINNARRLWFWSGAASLSQLAVDGVANPGECKFPEAVSTIVVFEVIEILDTTAKAKQSIDGVAIWKK
jgi:hypothetical protein